METDQPDAAQRHPAEQERLPLEEPSRQPIPFELTARARRVVAPGSLPDLSVLRGPSDGDEHPPGSPGDTRPARARALRRAGLGYASIAAELGLDEAVVRGWCGAVAPGRRRTRLRPVAGRAAGAAPRDDVVPGHADHGPGGSDSATVGAGMDRSDAAAVDADARAGVEGARTSAAARLATEAAFARDAGLVVGAAELDRHAVTVRVGDRGLAAAVLGCLRRWADLDPRRVRVVLRLTPDAAADIAEHRWAEALALPRERVAHTRQRDAAGAVAQATIRIADPELAITLSGWRQALLEAVGDRPAGRDDVNAAPPVDAPADGA